MDLRTPDNLEVFHAVFPRGASLERESSVDCLFLVSNAHPRGGGISFDKSGGTLKVLNEASFENLRLKQDNLPINQHSTLQQ